MSTHVSHQQIGRDMKMYSAGKQEAVYDDVYDIFDCYEDELAAKNTKEAFAEVCKKHDANGDGILTPEEAYAVWKELHIDEYAF